MNWASDTLAIITTNTNSGFPATAVWMTSASRSCLVLIHHGMTGFKSIQELHWIFRFQIDFDLSMPRQRNNSELGNSPTYIPFFNLFFMELIDIDLCQNKIVRQILSDCWIGENLVLSFLTRHTPISSEENKRDRKST